jgi:hypothetical protein
VADIGSALIAGGAGLIGALIGAFSAQIAARKTREADRRKRCVDRVLASLTQLDTAYAEYVVAAESNPADPKVVLPLQGALRGYNQAVQMLDNVWLRKHAIQYRNSLTEFYLMLGPPRDPLDDERPVPTLQQLSEQHDRLSEELRGYERT